jgi:hypothetical protein
MLRSLMRNVKPRHLPVEKRLEQLEANEIQQAELVKNMAMHFAHGACYKA